MRLELKPLRGSELRISRSLGYRCEVVVFRRSENWASTYYVIGDVITLDSVGVTLSVEEIYERVDNDDMVKWLAEQSEQ